MKRREEKKNEETRIDTRRAVINGVGLHYRELERTGGGGGGGGERKKEGRRKGRR